jgi:hypothetical protein
LRSGPAPDVRRRAACWRPAARLIRMFAGLFGPAVGYDEAALV